MFRSLVRDVVFPQAEHARLSATIALAWDAEAYPVGGLSFEPFVEGVALHDRGYGQLDDDAIGEVAGIAGWRSRKRGSPLRAATRPSTWSLRCTSTGWSPDNPTTPCGRPAPSGWRSRYRHCANQRAWAESEARDADRVTNLCDRISFDFCEEAAGEGAVEVRAADGTLVPIAYRLDGGHVTLDPWPLRTPELHDVVTGFHAAGYPDVLRPVIALFSATPAH